MYDFYYDNFSAPAGWLLLICLMAAAVCHIVVLYLESKIDEAVKVAQNEVRQVDALHVAVKEREQLEIWRSARKVLVYITPLLLAGWLVGLGRP